MIELTLMTALLLYLGLTLTIVLGLWIISHYRTRSKKILPLEQRLCICEYCHLAYVADSLKSVTQCPQCKSYNKDNRHLA